MLVRSRTWTEVTLVSSWGERGDDEEVGEDGSENDGDRNEEDGDDDDDDEDVDHTSYMSRRPCKFFLASVNF